MSQKQLNALRKGAVPEGEVLNPYGKIGFNQRGVYRLGYLNGYRTEAMRRNRKKLKIKKAIALEQHELQEMARKNATAAMNTLIEIMKNKRSPEATRIAAASVIFDRGYGKASQTSITANVTNGKESDLTADELDRRTSKALKRIEELTNRTAKTSTGQKRPSDLRKLN